MNNWRQKYHIEPKSGWLNDPNGLCFFKGYYHVFYQYAKEATGGNKYWAHIKSKDLLHWEEAPIFLSPEHEYDKSGAYSGSALIKDDTMHIFYTGNVKKDGDFDYIYAGRESNTVHVTSLDGINVESGKVVMYNKDYPEGLSLHVRDPKVFEYEGKYYMVIGARTMEDKGEVLVFESEDLDNWKHIRTFETMAKIGYMWECPDLFEINGQWILMACPQGLEGGKYEFQNIYSCGYFIIEGDFRTNGFITEYKEADFGFDFYAPQTFVDDSGRTILIGWMGIIDPTYHSYPEGIGFCHNLTLPRELSLSGDGVILQRPVKKLDAKRRECVEFVADTVVKIDQLSADIEITGISGDGTLTLNDALELSYSKGIFALKFIDEDTAAGRTQRSIRLKELSDLRVIVDGSTVEIYLNDGRVVFSTRWFPASEHLTLNSTFVASGSRAYSLVA